MFIFMKLREELMKAASQVHCGLDLGAAGGSNLHTGLPAGAAGP